MVFGSRVRTGETTQWEDARRQLVGAVDERAIAAG